MIPAGQTRLGMLAERRPVVLLAVLVLLPPGLALASHGLIPGHHQPGSPITIVGEAVLALLAVGIVAALGWWRQSGLTSAFRPLRRLAAPMVLVGLYWSFLAASTLVARPHWDRLPALLVFVLLVGLAEEALFRGLALHALRRYGTLAAGLGSGVLFGLLHFTNLLGGAPPGRTAAQVVQASLVGIMLGAVRLGIGSLWPLVAIHALIDLPLLLAGQPPNQPVVALSTQFAVVLAVTAPFGLAGLVFLIRDSRREATAAGGH